MKTRNKVILSVLLVLILAGAGLAYHFYTNLKEAKSSLAPQLMKNEMLELENIDTSNIPINYDSIPQLKNLPKDSVKMLMKDGNVIKLKDGSVLARKDSHYVAVGRDSVKVLKDTATLLLADGDKINLKKGKMKIIPDSTRGLKKKAPKVVLKDTAIVMTNSKKIREYKAKVIKEYKDSVIKDFREKKMIARLDSVNRANEKKAKLLKGKKITIVITGVDSRLGTSSKHADANHILNFWLDEGKIEIITVPRGTTADAGLEDSIQNYLANVRSNKGRNAYLKELSRITGVRPLNNYVEFGFSQAIGLLELLGYEGDAVQKLRMLRSRKAFGSGDHQRSFNQGQFIRQILLAFIPKIDDITAEFMLRAGMLLVETNVDVSTLMDIRAKLLAKGFPRSPDDVLLHTKPRYGHQYLAYDFTDEGSSSDFYGVVSNTAKRLGLKENPHASEETTNLAKGKLDKILDKALRDTIKNPEAVVKALKVPFDQRSWFQLIDRDTRRQYRDRICHMLIQAYTRLNKKAEADKVRKALADEVKMFDNKGK